MAVLINEILNFSFRGKIENEWMVPRRRDFDSNKTKHKQVDSLHIAIFMLS
jgi:hypothetical protein